MTMNGINGTNTQMRQIGMNQAADSYSQNIQNQIANAQKQLQEKIKRIKPRTKARTRPINLGRILTFCKEVIS